MGDKYFKAILGFLSDYTVQQILDDCMLWLSEFIIFIWRIKTN
jgi:hypothetical protein